MPNAYVMIHLEVTNLEGFESGFATHIPGLLAEFGGKALVQRNTEVSILENQVTGRKADVHAIFEFSDRDSALAWYNSDQYQAIRPNRTNNTANTYFAIVDGADD